MTVRKPRGTPVGGQFAEDRKPSGPELKPIVRIPTMPDDVGGRDFSYEEALRQIGTRNVFAISGGRVLVISDEDHNQVGVSLPVSQGYQVHVYLANNDTYTVQRIFRGRVKGQREGIYAEDLGDVAWNASCYQNVEFGD